MNNSENGDIMDLLHNIKNKMESIENKLAGKHDVINLQVKEIKTVNIENLNLEELTYQLDNIDIKELSGMLNLGNTFSPTNTKEKKKSKPMKSKDLKHQDKEEISSDSTKRSEIKVLINGKSVPFEFKPAKGG